MRRLWVKGGVGAQQAKRCESHHRRSSNALPLLHFFLLPRVACMQPPFWYTLNPSTTSTHTYRQERPCPVPVAVKLAGAPFAVSSFHHRPTGRTASSSTHNNGGPPILIPPGQQEKEEARGVHRGGGHGAALAGGQQCVGQGVG